MSYQLVINQAKGSAARHMENDSLLLESLATRKCCILNFYQWEAPSATYGYFNNPFASLKEEGIHKHQLQLARRPTGGGIIFHHCDLAFSALVPHTHPKFSLNTLENYAFINSAVEKAIALFKGNAVDLGLLHKNSVARSDRSCCSSFCMAAPTVFDVMLEGRKVGGGAQRRTRHGYLHQGTISLALPTEEFVHDLLVNSHAVDQAMRQNSLSLLGECYTPIQWQEAKREMQTLLCQMMMKQFSS